MTSSDSGQEAPKAKPQAPKRLHYAWVVAMGFSLMFGGLACHYCQHTAGPGHGIWLYVLIGTLFSSLLFGLGLSFWLSVTWDVFGDTCPWRWRTWVALLPALIFFGYNAAAIVTAPPSPQRHFLEHFHAELPTDARNIKVLPPALPDPGYVYFAFGCSKQSTQTLIMKLKAEPIENEVGLELMFFRIARDWSALDWEKSLFFMKVARTGTGYILLTDASMEQVLVARDPGWAKSEEELAGKVE